MTFEEWAAYTIGFIQGFSWFIGFAIILYFSTRVNRFLRRDRKPEKTKKKSKRQRRIAEGEEL